MFSSVTGARLSGPDQYGVSRPLQRCSQGYDNARQPSTRCAGATKTLFDVAASFDGVVLVLDELYDNILTSVDSKEWDALKTLTSAGKPILWLTKGSRLVHRSTGGFMGRKAEEEYAERDGVLYVQRIVPDIDINTFKRDEVDGPTPVIRAEKVGSLDLMWNENHVEVVPVKPGFVKVEVIAIGVNFKDVATTMGIVHEDEYMIGCECSGVVKRLGEGVTKFKVGDRVAVMRSGTYANRLWAPVERTHVIPDWMSFEDAATIPLVYMTALYSSFHPGNLQEGMSVIIHSAADGVGLAAIQLALYKKARIFVTVGTEEKRDFLASTFGIPKSRMFSSRDTKFAEEIMRETDGRGIDVILNSLTGELLDAFWRICADGGVMVEIGKRDIVDRNALAMEPFDRNCSFRAIDLSYTKHVISPSMVERLLAEIFELVEARHVNAIQPIIEYGFDNVPAALAYIRRGQHIGKIVITNHGGDVQVPIRPALRTLQLRSDASYLIVGGLKGLCGSLAIHMARHGAKHIIVCNRSGTSDDTSARVVRSCFTYGCHIAESRGDVSDYDYVRSIFTSASERKIAGVIQGAMVLRDKPYEIMTNEDYHQAVECKVRGTWNLHKASRDQPLDFFTMLSSISGVVGNKGQANYAAANAFLDAFAHYRQAQGRPANSVDLGAIEDAVVQLVSTQVSRVLRLETEVEPGKPLQAYGLDSLSAVELRGWVRTKLGVELSTLDITNARSLYALCEKVLASLPQLNAE
ncbi:KR domain-containing protein [Xylaria sp. FL0043]|nr:KR domain-containing protein [Xylaria sp. FL0043]